MASSLRLRAIAAPVVALVAALSALASDVRAAPRAYRHDAATCAAPRHHAGDKRGCRAAARHERRDAKVPGTGFHATGEIPCAPTSGAPMGACKFGVTRRGLGEATVTVFLPSGAKRILVFEKGGVTADAPDAAILEKTDDLNKLTVGAERYEIPDAVISGG